MRILLPALLALLLVSAPARAEPVDPAQLKATLGEIASVLSRRAEDAGLELRWKGDITVWPGEGNAYYSALIPSVTLMLKGGFSVDFGDVAINAVPGKSPQEDSWVFSLALPSALILRDAAGDKVSDIRIGRQKAALVWSETVRAFTRMDLDYGDLSLAVKSTGTYNAKIDSIRFTAALKKGADGLWSGERFLKAENIVLSSLVPGQGGASARIGSVVSRSAMAGLDLARSLRARAARLESLNKGVEPSSREAVASLIEEVEAMAADYGGAFEANDLTFAFSPETPMSSLPGLTVSAASLKATGSTWGLRMPAGGGAAALDIRDIRAAGVPEPLAGLVPARAHLDVKLENMPMRDLLSTLASIIEDTATGKADDKASAERIAAMIGDLPHKMSAAGTTLTIRDTALDARDLKFSAEGLLTADPDSKLIALGTVTFRLIGLDELVAQYRASGESDVATHQYLQGILPLQLAGQLSKPAGGGPSVRTYAVELAHDGKILLNGVDVTMLKALVGGEPAAPQQ